MIPTADIRRVGSIDDDTMLTTRRDVKAMIALVPVLRKR
jgi:hypothetical protein